MGSVADRSRCLPLFLVFLLGTVSQVVAGELSLTLDFPAPTVTEIDGTVRLEFPETWTHGEPGAPALPWRGITVLLPPGEEITSVDVRGGERQTIDGRWVVAPAQPQYPLSREGSVRPVGFDPEVYASDRIFPANPIGPHSTQFLSGHGIGTFSVCPVEYIPAGGKISYWTGLELRITTQSTARARRSLDDLLRSRPRDERRIQRLVVNPESLAGYPTRTDVRLSRSLVDPAEDYEYVIITTSTFQSIFQDLAAFKTARGVPATIVLLSDIYAEYSGGDDPEKIRAFIIDAYNGWGTAYVLLGGDDEILPHRGFYATAYSDVDDDIPADLYYGALDGTWNTDGDSYWGEEGEEDLLPEVHIGRATVDNAVEAQNFVDKTIQYQQDPVAEDCNRAFLLSEILWADPTWGADYKDEIRFGSSAHGYTTAGFAGSDFEVSTLYDRDHGEWEKSAAIDSLSAGVNLCNHLGHSTVTYALRMVINDVDTEFTNNGLNHGFFIVYSQGCYCNSFDNRTEYGLYTVDAIGEHFVTDDKAAVAFVGNTRYGWGMHESTNGSSQYFDRQFFDAIFAEQITRIGEANDDSKTDNIPFITYGANRWCFYELCLLGDPELDIWTSVPTSLSVVHPDSAPTGPSSFTVAVSSAKSPVAQAQVCLMKLGDVYEVGWTDATGQVVFTPAPQSVGSMTVTVTKHDFLPYSAAVDIVGNVPPSAPEDLAAVPGDGEVELSWSANTEPDLAAYVIYRSTSPDPTDSLVSIPAPTTEWLDDGVVNDTTYYYRVRATDTAGMKSDYSDPVQATPATPVWVQIAHTALEDTEAADAPYPVVATITTHEAPLDPDSLFVVWNTQARSWAWALMESTGAPDEYIAHIPPQYCGTGVDYYILAVDSTYHRATHPDGAPDVFHSFLVDFAVILEDDFETDHGWVAGAPGDSAVLGLWERCNPEGTEAQPEDDHSPPPGMSAYITACEDGFSQGSYDVDGGRTTLLSPVFDLSEYTSATVSYYRWYSNDTGVAPGLDFWVVEITGDGSEWVALENTNQSDRSWVWMEFDVEDYVDLTDAVQLRFVAEDADEGSIVEAGVDDFRITACRGLVDLQSPVVVVSTPNGGEQIPGGTGNPYMVHWTCSDNVGVTSTEIVLSTDGGSTWPQMLASGRLESPWPWSVPDVNEGACRVKVICRDAADNEGIDESDGDFEIVGSTAVGALASGVPEVRLRQNRPNPFNPATEIEFVLPSRQSISLEVYGVDGRRVAVLAGGLYEAGDHRVVWRGEDDAGRKVSTGIYFYRLITEKKILARKMVMLE